MDESNAAGAVNLTDPHSRAVPNGHIGGAVDTPHWRSGLVVVR